MSTDEGFMIPSKEEVEQEQQGGAPIAAEDYIVKIAKIDLKRVPTFVNRIPNWSVLTIAYKTICLPFALKAGGTMRDTDGKEVAPLTRWIWRDVNPFSTGFMPDKVSPSFLRALVAYMEGTDIKDRIKAPNFVMISPDKKEITDEEQRTAFYKELTSGPDTPKPLTGKGYQAVPDIRAYEGGYIACAVEASEKGNKITKFSKLPESFVPPTADVEAEAMEKFKESYDKMVAKLDAKDRERIAQAQGQAVPDEDGELDISDVSF